MSAAVMRRLPLLTNSATRTYRRCAREYMFRFEARLAPVGERAEALRFGTLVHKALEAWWLNAAMPDPTAALRAALAAIQMEEADPFVRVLAEEMMRGYDARWGGAGLELVHVEEEFRAPLLNPATGAASRTWQHAGRLDVLVREVATGRLLIMEHKTSSEDIEPGSDYWRALLLDPQVSGYFRGARVLGHAPEGCLYDVLGKVKLRPSQVPLTDEAGVKIVLDANGVRVRTKDGKKWRETGDSAAGYVLQTRPETAEEYRARVREEIAENPERYYQRGEVVRLPDDEFEWAFDFWATGRQIRESQLSGLWPRNADACKRFGRRCDYWDICTGVTRADDPLAFRTLEWAHPELTPPAAGVELVAETSEVEV